MLRTLLFRCYACQCGLSYPGLENISRKYAHGVPGKRPERPLEVLGESGDCSTSAQNWVDVRIGDGGSFYLATGMRLLVHAHRQIQRRAGAVEVYHVPGHRRIAAGILLVNRVLPPFAEFLVFDFCNV